MDTVLQNGLVQLLTIIIGGALGIASAYVALFVQKANTKAKLEIAKIKDEEAQALLLNTLEKTEKLITTNIIAMENTVKKDLVKAIADGKVSKDELATLSVNVKENVLKQLGENSLNILNEGIGDLSGYIEVKIEESLAEFKKQI